MLSIIVCWDNGQQQLLRTIRALRRDAYDYASYMHVIDQCRCTLNVSLLVLADRKYQANQGNDTELERCFECYAVRIPGNMPSISLACSPTILRSIRDLSLQRLYTAFELIISSWSGNVHYLEWATFGQRSLSRIQMLFALTLSFKAPRLPK